MIEIDGIAGLVVHAGRDLGVSSWTTISQAQVDAFADVTDDHQWIHIDVERAANGPFGATIVHGYFTLALVARFNPTIFTVRNVKHALNYGLDRVRFPAPLPVGVPLRMRAKLTRVEPFDGGAQVMLKNTFERQGSDKPVCVAEVIVRYYGVG